MKLKAAFLWLNLALLQRVMGITKVSLVDHDDPNYTDKCLEITGELCSYCCLIDFEWCSQDIYNCEPIRDRNLDAMIDLAAGLCLVIVGFPLAGCMLRSCVLSRYCQRCYPNTGGVSILEFFCRATVYILCCGRRFSQTYPR